MLYRVLLRTILRGKDLDDMQDKLDIFLAAGKITIPQYEELCAILDDQLGI